MFILSFCIFQSSWSPGSGSELISKLGFLNDTMTGDVYPDEFKRLVELMEQSGNFTESWLYKETLETTKHWSLITLK